MAFCLFSDLHAGTGQKITPSETISHRLVKLVMMYKVMHNQVQVETI